jgi:Holliday junction resolvase RusA-like endonuclease
MQFLLPHTPAALSPNGNRAHYMVVSNARKEAREYACNLTIQQIIQSAHFPITPAEVSTYFRVYCEKPTTYRIIWNHYGTTQPDDDNVVARIKSHKDGICQALNINDKDLRLRGVDFIRDKGSKKTYTLIIE